MKPHNAAVKCSSCSEVTSPSRSFPKCYLCDGTFHFKCLQGELHQANWRGLTHDQKVLWSCKDCRINSGTELNQIFVSQNKSQVNSRSNSVSSVSSRSTEHESGKKRRLEDGIDDGNEDELTPGEVRLMKGFETLLSRAVSQISSEFLVVKEKIASLEQENLSLKDRTTALERENADLRGQIITTQGRTDDLEQYSRRNNVIITGVPEIERENRYDTANRIMSALTYELKLIDIDDCHRIHPRKNTQGPRPFVIKFVNRHMKRDFLAHCRRIRPTAELFGGSKGKPVYAGDHLTPKTTTLKNYARDKLTGFSYKVSTEDCIVVAWRESERKIFIRSCEQVDALINKLGTPTSNNTHE